MASRTGLGRGTQPRYRTPSRSPRQAGDFHGSAAVRSATGLVGRYSRAEVSPVGRCPVLIERDDELRAMSALASETASRSGARVVVITGDAGGGKSRLAQEFAASLPDGWSARTLRITRTGAPLPAVPDARPLALILDDAHLLEPSAVDALPVLLNELGSEAVLMVLTFRLGFHPAGCAEMRALSGLVRDPRAQEMRLLPLSPAGIDQMA